MVPRIQTRFRRRRFLRDQKKFKSQLLYRHLHRFPIGERLEAMTLPSGYTLTHRPGDDSYTGIIEKSDALSIGIDIGGLSGVWANPEKPEKYEWVSRFQKPGGEVYIGIRHREGIVPRRMICLTYPKPFPINFFAYVDSESDISEFLLIALSFECSGLTY